MNPSAQRAHPEYEFKTVIATGISAAPILLVMFHPMIDEVIADWDNISAPTAGFFNINDNAAIFKIIMGVLINPANGTFKFTSLYKLANFLKAANDPVKVTPPMNTPKYEAIACNMSGLSQAQYDPSDVVTAANPTRAWKPATHYGSSVTATLDPKVIPAYAPAPIKIRACVRTAGEKLQANNVTMRALPTPVAPSANPDLAVFYDANPTIAPIQRTPEVKYPIVAMCGTPE